MADNVLQLDRGGTNCQFVRTWLGPSLGWAMLPVAPEIIVVVTNPITIPAYASRVLLKAAVKAVSLPSVAQWLNASLPLANIAAFDRSLWIKDLSGLASTALPIVITPNGTDLIDLQAQYSIIQSGQLLRLYPLTDLSGWYVG